MKNRWQDLTTEQVSCSIKERLGDEATAKDFRTWHANVVAAAVLATQDASSRSARKRAISATMNDVADYLGNTPAVARSGYVDPRLVDLFEDGNTIDGDLAKKTMPRSGQAMSPKLEKAVRALLS